jgi:DNA modification methylase
MSVDILVGDCRTRLAELPDQSVQMCVTSPPYFGLRDYGHDGQIGLEQTPDAFVAELVSVFRAVKRVLRDDGTLWLNLGDSYSGSGKGPAGNLGATHDERNMEHKHSAIVPDGLKPKDLIGIPWRVAFALQADGWYLRQDIIWHKPNPMPESVKDRCTKAHEYIFLLSKSERYYYDSDAIAEDALTPGSTHVHVGGNGTKAEEKANDPLYATRPKKTWVTTETRNRRSVWTVPTAPFKGAHFATFPPDLIEPCIKAGSKAGDTVLDPFGGAGTTGLVADRLGRNAVLCELNPTYAELAENRIRQDNSLFAEVTRK